MSKCTMCMDRLEQGLKPICVLSCSMRALEFGPLEDLQQKYGRLQRLEDMPKESMTRPAVVLKAHDSKKEVIGWDPLRTLDLWKERQPHEGEPLPEIFSEASMVTQAPREIIGRNKLVLKAKNVKELMYYTTDNE